MQQEAAAFSFNVSEETGPEGILAEGNQKKGKTKTISWKVIWTFFWIGSWSWMKANA